MKNRLIVAAVLGLGAVAASVSAKPLFLLGGHSQASGSLQACDGDNNVCAQFQNGQTFVTWNDLDTEAAGNNWRYRVYRSTSPITSGNYSSAAKIGDYILNSSAQLPGDPTSSGSNPFTTTYRADSARPRMALSDLGTQQPAFSGLMAHIAETAESAYYAVVGFPVSGGVATGGSDVYLGSAGPIAESLGTWRGYKQYDSAASGRNSSGVITSPSGKPIIIELHGSSNANGCNVQDCQNGDIWAFLMGKNDGHWQEGLMRMMSVRQLTSISYPGGYLSMRLRDTISNSLGTASLETYWSGLGLTPLSYVGPANRRYLGTAAGMEKMLDWAISHYGADSNQLHHMGGSMGAMAIVTMSKMTSPRVASSWLLQPVWQMHVRDTGSWAGAGWTTNSHPFRATIASAPNTLGTTLSNVLLPDGSNWGGTGNYTDLFATMADQSAYFPPVYYGANLYDVSILSPATVQFQHQLDALAALQSSKRAHAFCWNVGSHNLDPTPAINCEKSGSTAGVCTSKSHFRLDRAHLAFFNSSIDDDPGTATLNASNIMDGDPTGCVNAGFQWTISSDTASAFNFTVDNTFMDRTPTPVRQTTLAGSGTVIPASGTGSVTVADGSVFVTGGANPYYVVGGTEILNITSVVGNTVTYNARAQVGTVAQAHNAGETIRQYVTIPTGPNAGSASTMTVDIAFRQKQGSLAPTTCNVTPNGGSLVAKTVLYDGIVPYITGVTINATGATSIACS